jgi:hypothetical protein
VSKYTKRKNFHLTPKILFRLLIFFIITSSLIYYFSTQNINENSLINKNVLGDQTTAASDMPLVKTIVDNLYNQLPPESRNLIENLNQSPVIILTQSKFEFIKVEAVGFPQKQINDIKMFFINKGRGILDNAAGKK